MQSARSVENLHGTNTVNAKRKTNARGESMGSNSELEKEQGTEAQAFDSKGETESQQDAVSTSNDSDDDLRFGITNPDDKPQNWWKDPVTVYAFNLPTVQANLERLVETNKVKFNDHRFMMNLRTSVWNDFNEKLSGRIKQREDIEIERTRQLILNCKYNVHTCPKKLIPLHSDVLALDFQNEETLTEPIQSDRYDAPVFTINKKTNIAVHLRRKKLKSVRKTNFQNLMRHVLKDFKSEKVEYNEAKAIKTKIKAISDSINKRTSILQDY